MYIYVLKNHVAYSCSNLHLGVLTSFAWAQGDQTGALQVICVDKYCCAQSYAGLAGGIDSLRTPPREGSEEPGSDSSSAMLSDAHGDSCQFEISLLCALLHHGRASTAGLHLPLVIL